MDPIETLAAIFDHTGTIVAKVGPDQHGNPTPCHEWDVATLLSHLTGVVVNVGLGVRGEPLLPGGPAVGLDVDPGAQFAAAAERTLAAWRQRGLDGLVDIGAGPMPASIALGINCVDTSAHSWDVARATGQDPVLPDSLAATTLELAQGFLTDEVRDFAGFDAAIELPADPSPTDRFVAFLGRQP